MNIKQLICLCLIFSASFSFAADNQILKLYKDKYQEQLQKKKVTLEQLQFKLCEDTIDALTRVQKNYQQQGQLKAYIAIKGLLEEVKFQELTLLGKNLMAYSKAQEVLQKMKSKNKSLLTSFDKSVRDLQASLIKALNKKIVSLTQENKIEDAIALRTYVKKLNSKPTSKPNTPVKPPTKAPIRAATSVQTVSGLNAIFIDTGIGITFEKGNDKKWRELDKSGKLKFTFTEKQKSKNEIHIYDQGRKMAIIFKLDQKRLFFQMPNEKPVSLYPIKSYSSSIIKNTPKQPSHANLATSKVKGFAGTAAIEKDPYGYKVWPDRKPGYRYTLKKLNRSLKSGTITVRCKIKSCVPSSYKNGYLILSQENCGQPSINAGAAFQLKQMAIFYSSESAETTNKVRFTPKKELNFQLTINLDKRTVELRIDEFIVKNQLNPDIKSLNYIGFGVKNARTLFSEPQIEIR